MRSFHSIDVPLLNSKVFLFRSLKRSKTFLPLATLITIESFWLFCTPSYINLVSDYRSSCLETGSSFQLRFFNFPSPEFGKWFTCAHQSSKLWSRLMSLMSCSLMNWCCVQSEFRAPNCESQVVNQKCGMVNRKWWFAIMTANYARLMIAINSTDCFAALALAITVSWRKKSQLKSFQLKLPRSKQRQLIRYRRR